MKRQSAYRETEAMLMRMMSLTDADMFRLIETSGLQYLNYQCRDDQQAIDYLKTQTFYWNWFRREWYRRNEEFVALHELQNGENTDTEYAFWIDEFGELQTMTLYGAYRLYHQEAMAGDEMDKSYCHIMTHTDRRWRKQVYNH